MNKPLRILHLEDQPDFSTLVSAILERDGLNAKKVLVTDFAKFTAALENDSFDIIIADYMLPTCNGLQALELAKAKRPEIPFVLLSGAIGEHAAIDILRSGANDYVLKSGLERLVPAIRRAVQEAEEREIRQAAEKESQGNIARDVSELRKEVERLKKTEARLLAALRIARLGSWELEITDANNIESNTLHSSDETLRIFGFKPGQALSVSDFFFKSVHPADRQRVKDLLELSLRNKERYEGEYRIVQPGGGERVIAGRAEMALGENGKPAHLRGIVIDVTQRQRPAGQDTARFQAPAPAEAAPAAAAPKPEKPSKNGKKIPAPGRKTR